MKFLFWTFWTVDVLSTALVVFGAQMRSNWNLQHPFTSVHFWSLVLGGLAIVGGLVLRLVFKMPKASLLFVALPLIVGFVFYLIDSRNKGV